MDKSSIWIEQLKKLAQENYSKGYGYQVFVECYDKAQWEEFVSGIEYWEECLEIFHAIASIRTEQHQEAQNEIF